MRRQSAIRTLILIMTLSAMIPGETVFGADRLIIDADSQYRYAQSRLDAGAYDEAVSEFDRFIYFFPTDVRIPKAHFQVAMAHYDAGRYQAAASIFDTLISDQTAASLKNEAFFMLSRSHARQGMIDQAMVDLHNLIALSAHDDIIDRARYELGWLQVDRGQWNKADRSFSQMTPDNRRRFRVEELKSTLALHDTIATKNPATAGLLSIVPGGGQLYCGRYQDALTAFLINAGLILSAWEAFDNDLVALGGVISFVEFGFYAGNIYGAISDAHKVNRDRIDGFRQMLYRHRTMPLSLVPVKSGAALCLSVDF